MQTFNGFQELAASSSGQSSQSAFNSAEVTENAPGVGDLYQRPDLPPPTPATPTSDRNPQQEAWGWQQQREWNAKQDTNWQQQREWNKQQKEWNTKVEQKLDNLEKNMATKAEMQQLEQRLDQRFTKLEQMIQQR